MHEVPLDFVVPPEFVSVKVRRLAAVLSAEQQYFVRRASIRSLFTYARSIGIGATLRKVRSRTSERLRNRRFLSVGIGELETPLANAVSSQIVLFAATTAPFWCERIPVHRDALRPIQLAQEVRDGAFTMDSLQVPVPADLASAVAWNPESGTPFPRVLSEWLSTRETELVDELTHRVPTVSIQVTRSQRTMSRQRQRNADQPTLAVVGFGNYARTVAVPALSRHLRPIEFVDSDPLVLSSVHPQIGIACASGPGEEALAATAVLIAGYHHTHAPLAAHVLAAGKWAIVEKPAATTQDQIVVLLNAARASNRLLVCFQRRYDRFTERALRDLRVGAGTPVNYSCIVYEVPLPKYHWYRWPNSGSRLLSNGCHWVDHFLWLNRGANVETKSVVAGRNGTVLVWIELSNAATFSMYLTEYGSPRLGIQDVVDLRVADATVRITNSATYQFEAPDGRVAKRHQSRMAPYRRMYDEIGRRIVEGLDGDDLAHNAVSLQTVLDLERLFQSAPLRENGAYSAPAMAR